MKKILIIAITKDGVMKECMQSWCNQDYKGKYAILVRAQEEKFLDEKDTTKRKVYNMVDNRENLRQMALQTDFDYFLFVDSDIVLPANALTELSTQLDTDPTKHLMAGWYLMSCLNKHGKRKLNKSGYALSRYVADNTIFPLIRIEQSVVQVDSVGLGCCMVTRKLLKKAKIKMGEDIYIKDVYGKNIIHDDSSYFSNIVARLGYCLWADGSVVCKHLIGKT